MGSKVYIGLWFVSCYNMYELQMKKNGKIFSVAAFIIIPYRSTFIGSVLQNHISGMCLCWRLFL